MSGNENLPGKPLLKQASKIIRNPHFWALLIVVLILTAFYYIASDINSAIYSRLPIIRSFIIFEFSHTLNGSLFYIPFIYSSLIFWRRGTLFTTLLIWLFSVLLMQPYIFAYTANSLFVFYNNLFLSIPMLLIALVTLELKLRQRERKALTEREMERQTYLARIIEAQEDERKRISQELHDDTIQTLLVAVNRLQASISDDPSLNSETREQLESTRDTLLRVTEDMRRLSLDLRPVILDNLGLLSALRWLNDRFCEDAHIDSKFTVNGEERKLSSLLDLFIFRFVQEALNNIRKYSEATHVSIELEFKNSAIRLTVEDNGKGFLLPENINKFTSEGKLGLIGMQERARLVNGIFTIHSAPGKGTQLSVTINT
jgi:two-component system, NarL family, sensor histidine kinase DegS